MRLFRHFISCTVMLIFVLSVFMPVTAQDSPSDTPLTAYLLQDNQLKTIDETTGNREVVSGQIMPSISRSDRADQRLLAASIDHQAKFIYLIEGWGRSTNRRILGAPTGAELVQFDIAGGGRKVVGDLTTVFNVVPSPDGSQLIVFYYDGEYLYAVQRACVVHLDLNPTDCRNVSLDYVGTSAFWLDNQSFVIGTNEVQSLRLIDAATGIPEVLRFPPEWYTYWGMLIPGTNLLLVSAKLREVPVSGSVVNFLKLNLETMKVDVLPYTALDTSEYLSVSELSFSPNGQYLLYRGLKFALVEFATGRLLREFDVIYSQTWLDNQTLLVQGSYDGRDLEIFQFDAVSGASTTLLRGEEAAGVLLVP